MKGIKGRLDFNSSLTEVESLEFTRSFFRASLLAVRYNQLAIVKYLIKSVESDTLNMRFGGILASNWSGSLKTKKLKALLTCANDNMNTEIANFLKNHTFFTL